MNRKRTRLVLVSTGALGALAASAALAAPAGTSSGPSTPTDPYLLPAADGVSVKSLLTVSDDGAATNGYEMAGIPDGLGAYRDPKGRDFTLLMNHELRPDLGAVRRHGQTGAFVSELEIDPHTFEVEKGRDLIDPGVRFWDYPTRSYRVDVPSDGGANPRDPSDTFAAQVAQFARWCSSTLTAPGRLFNRSTKRGYRRQIYFGNEESGDEGRAFGVTTDGRAKQLPRLGLFSWENTQEADTDSDATVTIGSEDTATGQLWVHVGEKRRRGNPFRRAGLTNGSNFVVDLANEAVDGDAEFRATYGKGHPAPFTLGDAERVDWDSSGARQNADASAAGLTLNRIEDGNFDPRNPDDFYFVTTGGAPGVVPTEPSVARDGGGLWRLRFRNVARPERGGTLELLLDGSEPPYLNKPDNVTIDRHGNLLIQEDPGNNAQLARIVAYDIDTGERGALAEFDGALFRSGQPGFMTQDEESSGIIDARRLIGPRWFLLDAQVHKANPDPAAVEYGQLLALHVSSFADVYTIAGGP